jgi:hypothetical protein
MIGWSPFCSIISTQALGCAAIPTLNSSNVVFQDPRDLLGNGRLPWIPFTYAAAKPEGHEMSAESTAVGSRLIGEGIVVRACSS